MNSKPPNRSPVSRALNRGRSSYWLHDGAYRWLPARYAREFSSVSADAFEITPVEDQAWRHQQT